MRNKELWFRHFERNLNELAGEGVPNAYEKASKQAEEDAADYLAALADEAKDRRKYGDMA